MGDEGKFVLLTATKLPIAVGLPASIKYLSGLPVVALYGKLKDVALVVILLTVPNVIVGTTFTVPVTEIVCAVAPVEVQVIVPEGLPLAVAANLANTEVAATVPPLCVIVILLL